MPTPNLATIEGRKIVSAAGFAAPTYRAAGRLVAHKTLSATRGDWSLSMPCGASVGQSYASRAVALEAAAQIAPLVVNWDGQTVAEAFGTVERARLAYDRAEAVRKAALRPALRGRGGLGV